MSPQASDVYLAYPHAVQPSHAPPALIPPNHNAAAMNGSGTTQSGLRLIQKQPSPKSTSQAAMKIPTAQPGAISPEARKKGARASIAARANTPAAYLAPVRASRGMGASSHVPWSTSTPGSSSEPNTAGLCLGTRLRTRRGCRKTVS
jgi:hypothetical protein